MNHHRTSEDSDFTLVPIDTNSGAHQPYSSYKAFFMCCRSSRTCTTLISSQQAQQSISEPSLFLNQTPSSHPESECENRSCPQVTAQASLCNADVWANNCSPFINTCADKWWLCRNLICNSGSHCRNQRKTCIYAVKPVFMLSRLEVKQQSS